MRRRPALFALLLTIFSLVLLSARRADAALFQVNPVRLSLSAQTTSGLLTVHNQSQEPLRFQITAHEWRQTPDGEMTLLPTTDVAVFPSMVTVPAGASRKVRVGVLTPSGASEKTYRVFVEELPPLSAPGASNGVRVLTRMGIPVFQAALAPTATPTIDALALRAGKLSFSVKNGGNTHFMNTTIRVVARNSAGQVTHESKTKGWYVLGDSYRLHDLSLPPTSCANLASITVEIETDQGNASASLNATSAQCLR